MCVCVSVRSLFLHCDIVFMTFKQINTKTITTNNKKDNHSLMHVFFY